MPARAYLLQAGRLLHHIDLFAEEDMQYARRLVHAGVATELLVVRRAFHGFDLLAPDAEASQQFSASWKSALRKAFVARNGH